MRGRAQRRQLLDWLMGGAVLAETDRVVSENVDYGQFHQRRQAQRRLEIIAENQEARSEGPNLAQRQAVANRGHRVFANPEMKIAADAIIGLEITGALKRKPGL